MPGSHGTTLRRYGPPWLIVHGPGPASEDHAIAARERCAAAGIDTRERSIDDVADLSLATYTGLLVFLPMLPPTTNVTSALPPFAQLVGDYRMRRPRGLEDVLTGRSAWFEAGVVQMFGERVLLDHPALRTAKRQVCRAHELDGGAAVDVLQVYQQDTPVIVDLAPRYAGDVLEETIKQVWHRVNAWGIHEIAAVPRLLLCITACQHHYEDPKFSELHRPLPGVNRNRLDIILVGPDPKIDNKAAKKTWQENGARVYRYVDQRLRTVVPSLKCPRANDKQKALRQLYRDLLILADVEGGETEMAQPNMIR